MKVFRLVLELEESPLSNEFLLHKMLVYADVLRPRIFTHQKAQLSTRQNEAQMNNFILLFLYF